MTTAQALTAFMVHYAQWLNLSGDSERFFKIKTARAWTKFHHAATKGRA